MTEKIEIPYGDSKLFFDLPQGMKLGTLAKPAHSPALEEGEVKEEVISGLENPIGMADLSDLFKTDYQVAIVVDDISRPTPTALLVSPLIEYLTSNLGVNPDNIVFIFGLGVHREMTQKEAEIKLGKDIAQKYRWENHNCYDNLVDLGYSSRGTPILVNKTYYKSDVKISVGLIEPHLWAGYSGGSKGIIPGIAGLDTIVKNHRLVMKHGVEPGNLENNPFKDDIDEMVEKTDLDLLVNCVLTPEKQIHRVVIGESKAAFLEGVSLSRQKSALPVDQKSDVIVSSPYPLGIDFRQSSKALFNTKSALKSGGVMVVVSPCPEGRGNIKSPDRPPKRWLIQLLAKILPGGLLMRIIKKQGYGVEDAAGTFQMFKFISNYQYIFVSDNISEEDKEALFVADHTDSIEEALQMAKDKIGNRKDLVVNVFPSGGATFPVLE